MGTEKFIVTGAAGFIGSNVVRGLNQRGVTEIIAVDHLDSPGKAANLLNLKIMDYYDRDEFLQLVEQRYDFGALSAVIHEGACTSTVEQDGAYMMRNNFSYSKQLLAYCLERGVFFQYASTAGVYGQNTQSREVPQNESPRTIYAYSKLLFDCWVRRCFRDARSPVVALRYFNVYGSGEGHKGFMRSSPLAFYSQLRERGWAGVFAGDEKVPASEHLRDFVSVDDVVAVKLWFLDQSVSGIFNVGTGSSRTFEEVAKTVVDSFGQGEYRHIPFPEKLKAGYQFLTRADLTALRRVGYRDSFVEMQAGVSAYIQHLLREDQLPQ